MNNKHRAQYIPNSLSQSLTGHVSTHLKQSIDEIFNDSLSLKLLQFLQNEMQPHHKFFNIIQMALMIDKYIDQYLLKMIHPTVNEQQFGKLNLTTLSPELKLSRHFSQNIKQQNTFQLRKEETFQLLLEQLKTIFLYYIKPTLSYELINEYIYNQQLRALDHRQKDEDYMQIGQKRVRIDPNLKLCIMPLGGDAQICKNTKIKELIFRQNQEGNQLQTIFAVTKDYVRCLSIKPELIGIAADFDPTGYHPQKCWYNYKNQYIRPKRNTVNVQFKQQQSPIFNSKEMKQLKAVCATNIDEQYPSHLLNVLKACAGQGVVGIINLDQSLIIEPLSTDGLKNSQGYIGNLMRDIPEEIQFKERNKEKYLQILLFQNYSHNQWLIVTSKFIYLYRVPIPGENIVLPQQNNLHKTNSRKTNPLLLLCQRVPQGCSKAVFLQKPFLALMLSRNMVVIIKLIINSQSIFENDEKLKEAAIASNYYKITNKIYNDIQFKCMTFNSTYNNLFLSDFGSYLIRLSFNSNYGDIEEEGAAYSNEQNQSVNQELVRNSYAYLTLTKNRSQPQVILELDDQQAQEETQQYIQVNYLKQNNTKQNNQVLSPYKKQNKSPHTIVIKNQTRQVITLMSTNKHFNSLITYESQSIESTTGSQFEGEKYRQWNNKNKIKLWDICHMTIYQIINVSIEISFLELRSNGLYAVTTQKGYLGFYPFNEDKKIQIGQTEQRMIDRQAREVYQQLSSDIILKQGTLYFSSTVSSSNKHNGLKINRTNIHKLQLQKYPHSQLLQSLPSDITALTVSDRVYVLQNSSQGVQACQLHIYNKMGLKQEMMVFSNREDVDVTTGKIRGDNYNQEYKYLCSINHQQFNVVLWNTDSLKLIGGSRQDSFTVVFHSSKFKNTIEGVQQLHNIRTIQVTGRLIIVYCQNTLKIKDKAASVNSKSSNQNKSRPRHSKSMNRVHQHIDYSILLMSCDNDRIIYKLRRINQRVKVLHFHNSLLITQQVDLMNPSYDIVRVLDVAQLGQLTNKVLFSVKFHRIFIQRIQSRDLSRDFHQHNQNYNLLLQQLKEVNVKKIVSLEESRVTVSQSNKLILILVFRVETQYSELLTNKALQSQVQFMVYARNISDELLNSNYKISRLHIGKKATKHSYEYETTTGRMEPVIGHKVLTLDELNSISNYNEVDMEQLCELMTGQFADKYSGVDITGLIITPNMFMNDRQRDVYELLTLRKNQSLFEIFQKFENKATAINSFNFHLLQFNEDDLTGMVSVSNKLLMTISLYAFQVECLRETDNDSDPCLLSMKFNEIGLMQVKSQAEMKRVYKLQKTQPGLSSQKLEPVQLLKWSKDYKTGIERMWDSTYHQIKEFVHQERFKLGKSASLPPINFKLISPVKIKKAQILKRRLSISERQQQKSVPQQEVTPESMAKMFKKWTIGQAITYEHQQAANNKKKQLNSMKKYINRVLQSSEDTAQRVTDLIKNTSQIKEIMRTEDKQQNVRHQVQKKIKKIMESAEIAQESSLRAYVLKKFSNHTNTIHPKFESPKISRTETNKSLLQEIRVSEGPASKLSFMSSQTYHSPKKKSQSGVKIKMQGLEQKLMKKLDQLQDRPISELKANSSKLQFFTPQRVTDLRKTILKTKTQPSPVETSPNKSRVIKFATEQSQTSKLPINKSYLNTLILPSVSQHHIRQTESSESEAGVKKGKLSSTRYESESRYQVSYSLLKLKSNQRPSTEQQQGRVWSPQAVKKLQKSQRLMREVVLPQMATNKQKLMGKMKEKKSYIKMIQSHLNDSSVATLRQGEERKKIINKLLECR